jgi:hypothetical protein
LAPLFDAEDVAALERHTLALLDHGFGGLMSLIVLATCAPSPRSRHW